MAYWPRRFRLNHEGLNFVLQREFEGNLSAMARHCGVEAKTLRSWMQGKTSEVNGSSIRHVADKVGYSVAFLANRYAGKTKSVPSAWLRYVRDATGSSFKHLHPGELMPVDDGRPHLAGWKFDPNEKPHWAVLEVAYRGAELDAVFSFSRKLALMECVYDYVFIEHKLNALHSVETWTKRELNKTLSQNEKRFRCVTWHDPWARSFAARANVPFEITLAGKLSESEAKEAMWGQDNATLVFWRTGHHPEPKDAN